MATVTSLTEARIKKLVREALRGSKMGRLSRAQILRHVIHAANLTLLPGERKVLSGRVNKIIGVMIRTKKEPIEKAKRGEKIVLTTWKQTMSPSAMRGKIVMSLMSRIRLIEVNCLKCGAIVKVTRFDRPEECEKCGRAVV